MPELSKWSYEERRLEQDVIWEWLCTEFAVSYLNVFPDINTQISWVKQAPLGLYVQFLKVLLHNPPLLHNISLNFWIKEMLWSLKGLNR